MPKAPMPKMRPAPPELTARFAELFAAMPGVEPKKMFGYLAGFTGGNMFAGIFQDSLILRLDEPDRLALVQKGGAPFEPMPGRVMREYLVVPKAVLDSSKQLSQWLQKAQEYGASLPSKQKAAKAAAKRAAKPAAKRK